MDIIPGLSLSCIMQNPGKSQINISKNGGTKATPQQESFAFPSRALSLMSLSSNSLEDVRLFQLESGAALDPVRFDKGPGSCRQKHGCQEPTPKVEYRAHIWFDFLSSIYTVSYHLHRKSCDKVALCNKFSSHFTSIFYWCYVLNLKNIFVTGPKVQVQSGPSLWSCNEGRGRIFAWDLSHRSLLSVTSALTPPCFFFSSRPVCPTVYQHLHPNIQWHFKSVFPILNLSSHGLLLVLDYLH